MAMETLHIVFEPGDFRSVWVERGPGLRVSSSKAIDKFQAKLQTVEIEENSKVLFYFYEKDLTLWNLPLSASKPALEFGGIFDRVAKTAAREKCLTDSGQSTPSIEDLYAQLEKVWVVRMSYRGPPPIVKSGWGRPVGGRKIPIGSPLDKPPADIFPDKRFGDFFWVDERSAWHACTSDGRVYLLARTAEYEVEWGCWNVTSHNHELCFPDCKTVWDHLRET